jgi:hypothetical protein
MYPAKCKKSVEEVAENHLDKCAHIIIPAMIIYGGGILQNHMLEFYRIICSAIDLTFKSLFFRWTTHCSRA